MNRIDLDHCSLEIPVRAQLQPSMRAQFVNTLTGGRIRRSGRNGAIVTAVSDVTLQLRPGDRVGIAGPNGSGKSSLLRMMAGVYQPSSGKVTRVGTVSTLFDLSLGLDPDSTGRDNIRLMAIYRGLSMRFIKQMEDAIIDFSDLGLFIDLPVRTYSSGMVLRLGFAVAVLIESDILIMDEWLAVGDENFAKKAEQKLLSLVESASIVVIATHNPQLIEKVCNRRVMLDAGRVSSDEPIIANSNEAAEQARSELLTQAVFNE